MVIDTGPHSTHINPDEVRRIFMWGRAAVAVAVAAPRGAAPLNSHITGVGVGVGPRGQAAPRFSSPPQ